MKVVTREKWGARPPKYVNRGSLSSASTVHWNGPTITVKGELTWDHSLCAGLVRGIQNYHMDGHGWSDIAYNFVVCPHGYTFVGRGINVINGANGTNIGNQTSHAVMTLAGETNPFSNDEKVAIKETVYHISNVSVAPNEAIGHRDHKSTECPGDERYNWVHQGMPVLSPPLPMPVIKKGKKMNSFLFRTTKSPAVWLVDGDLMQKRWVQDGNLLVGYQQLLEANGLSKDVCVLHSTEPISLAIANIPAHGPVPDGYDGPRV